MPRDGRALSDQYFKSVQSMPTGLAKDPDIARAQELGISPRSDIQKKMKEAGKVGRALSDRDIQNIKKKMKSKKKKLPKGQRSI